MVHANENITNGFVGSSEKRHPKVSILTDVGVLTSEYGIGEWVYYGEDEDEESLGKIAGIAWQDVRPVVGTEFNGWAGDSEEGGFVYQIFSPTDFELWTSVPEECIVCPVEPAPSGDCEDLRKSYLQQMNLISQIRYCFERCKRELPDELHTALGFNSVWGKPKYLPGMHVRWQCEKQGGTAVIVGVERSLDSEPGYWEYALASLTGTKLDRDRIAEYRITEILDTLSLDKVSFLSE
jgi:hypothetical protein